MECPAMEATMRVLLEDGGLTSAEGPDEKIPL